MTVFLLQAFRTWFHSLMLICCCPGTIQMQINDTTTKGGKTTAVSCSETNRMTDKCSAVKVKVQAVVWGQCQSVNEKSKKCQSWQLFKKQGFFRMKLNSKCSGSQAATAHYNDNNDTLTFQTTFCHVCFAHVGYHGDDENMIHRSAAGRTDHDSPGGGGGDSSCSDADEVFIWTGSNDLTEVYELTNTWRGFWIIEDALKVTTSCCCLCLDLQPEWLNDAVVLCRLQHFKCQALKQSHYCRRNLCVFTMTNYWLSEKTLTGKRWIFSSSVVLPWQPAF